MFLPTVVRCTVTPHSFWSLSIMFFVESSWFSSLYVFRIFKSEIVRSSALSSAFGVLFVFAIKQHSFALVLLLL